MGFWSRLFGRHDDEDPMMRHVINEAWRTGRAVVAERQEDGSVKVTYGEPPMKAPDTKKAPDTNITNIFGDKGPKCGLCNGLGIMEDPQHGHAFRCSRCGGTGVQE